MFIVYCPICDYKIKFKDVLITCPDCGFDFTSNRCSNLECKKPLHYSHKFCPECGFESNFYLDSYDITPYIEDN